MGSLLNIPPGTTIFRNFYGLLEINDVFMIAIIGCKLQYHHPLDDDMFNLVVTEVGTYGRTTLFQTELLDKSEKIALNKARSDIYQKHRAIVRPKLGINVHASKFTDLFFYVLGMPV